MDEIRNEGIRGTAQVEQFGDNVRDKVEMIWTCAEKE